MPVRYPTDLFQQDPAGLSDLYTEDGVKGWITKLDTEERVTEWLAGFDEKETNENVQDYQTMEYTVAGYPARAIVYQDAEGWHSEVIVNFGKTWAMKPTPCMRPIFTLQGIRMYPYGMKRFKE